MNIHDLEEKRKKLRKINLLTFIIKNRKRKYYLNIIREIIFKLKRKVTDKLLYFIYLNLVI